MPEQTILTNRSGSDLYHPSKFDGRVLEALWKERFTSQILPKFMRRASNIDTLVLV